MNFRNLLIAAAGLSVLAGAASAQQSQFLADHPERAQWQANHPARTEVNRRDVRINNQVARAERSGQISPRQAYRDRVALRNIRRQEHAFAVRHGGRITYAEQARLNREEARIHNHVN